MNLLYFGNGRRGVVCLEAVLEAGFRIAGAVVHPGQRGRRDDRSVGEAAARAGIEVFDPADVNDPAFVTRMAALEADLGVMAGYAKILKRPMLAVAPRGIVNLHGGKLPDYRGGSPINWQVINGETTGGCTVLYADEGIDTGDVLLERHYPIGPDETAGEVTARTLEVFPPLLLEVLRRIERGESGGRKQVIRQGRTWTKRYPWDGEIDWPRFSDRQVHDLVRGLSGPELPPAYTHLDGEKVEVLETRTIEETFCGPPGRIARRLGGGAVVICRDRGVLVTRVRRPDGVARDGASLEIRGATLGTEGRQRGAAVPP